MNRGRCAWLLAGVLVLGVGCVDLTEPWNTNVAADAAVGARGGTIGGQGGASGDGGGGSVDVSESGRGGVGGALDGGLATSDVAADISLGETGGSAGSSQAALDGGGGREAGGAVGSDAPVTAGTGGAAGSMFLDAGEDAGKNDGAVVAPDLGRADRAADAQADVQDVPPAADVAADTAADVEQVSNAGLVVYYPCEGSAGSSGTRLPDQSGNGNHGVLSTGPAPSGGASGTGGTGSGGSPGGSGGALGFTFSAGKFGKGLALNAAAYAYVELPPDLLVGSRELTIAVWVKVESTSSFQRVFDFGVDTNTFMYLTTANSKNTGARFRISVQGDPDAGNGVSQVLESTQPIPTGTWTHLGIVLSSQGGALYVNGSLQASDPGLTLRPADLGSTPNNFIGRSLFPVDPYLDGEIDELRIYTRALSEQEMAKLAGN